MENIKKYFVLFIFVFLIAGCQSEDSSKSETNVSAFVIDHNCTDISKIPIEWINKAKELFKIHYAHTSHGDQITQGLQLLSSENSLLSFLISYCSVPISQGGLSMMDGQYIPQDSYCETYITPDLYWESEYGLNITQWVLGNFDVNVSLWAWCSQPDYYSQSEIQNYLNRMSILEAEFPNITFIYMTGNSQSADQNRYQRNNEIREYCKNNQKFLFDFADLDCWYNGEQYTENGIPTEHPHYHGDQAGHTTYESCRNKAKAFWWMLARLAGWEGT